MSAKIQRFTPTVLEMFEDFPTFPTCETSSGGEYVLFSEHEQKINQLRTSMQAAVDAIWKNSDVNINSQNPLRQTWLDLQAALESV